MSRVAVPHHTDATRAQTVSPGGMAWFVLMVGVWAAFVTLAVASPDTLGNIWSDVRGLPAAVEVPLWLLTLPWMLGLAVWESSWETWLRVLLVAWIAAGWTIATVPRTRIGR